jgi:hypothetical protein
VAAYHTDEIILDVPEDWVDRSINVFLSSPGDRVPFNILVTRDVLRGEELAPFVRRQLQDLSKKLTKMIILGQRDRQIGPLAGREARLQWLQQGNLMYQHQVYVPYYGVALTITASSIAKLAVRCDEYLEQFLATLRFRKQ